MKLFDIYKNKTDNSLIQIQCYANHLNVSENSIVVFSNIEKHSDNEIGYCPSFNGYGTRTEIEEKYELLVAQKDLDKYDTWNDILKLIE